MHKALESQGVSRERTFICGSPAQSPSPAWQLSFLAISDTFLAFSPRKGGRLLQLLQCPLGPALQALSPPPGFTAGPAKWSKAGTHHQGSRASPAPAISCRAGPCSRWSSAWWSAQGAAGRPRQTSSCLRAAPALASPLFFPPFSARLYPVAASRFLGSCLRFVRLSISLVLAQEQHVLGFLLHAQDVGPHQTATSSAWTWGQRCPDPLPSLPSPTCF